MSASLTNPLPVFAFSKNEILAVLSSNAYIATAGVKAVVNITFAGAVADGLQVPLVWTGKSMAMTAAAAPDTSGFQFPPGDGSAGYVAGLKDTYSSNYYIRRDFIVTAVGTKLVLTGRNAGADLNIVPGVFGNITVSLASTGVNLLLKPNFKFLLDIYSGNTQIYSRTLSLDQPLTGQTTKDLSEALHAYVANLGSDAPSLTAAGWQLCSRTIAPYRIEFAEYFGDNPQVQLVTSSADAYVNRGALSVQAAVGQTMQGYLSPTPSTTMCLRQGSRAIPVRTDQPEFLYWINFTGADVSIRCKVVTYLTDGTAPFYYTPVFNALANNKYYLPAGFIALDVKANIPSGKSCNSYSVQIISAAGAILSLNYTYLIDQYREFPYYFIYLNSLGGYQTLYTWGRSAPEIARTGETIKRQVTATEAAKSGRTRETNIRTQKSSTVFTGFRTEREILLLEDLLLSEEVYLVDAGRLVPVGLSSDKLMLPADGENLNGASFEYYLLSDELAYTDDKGLPDDAITGPGSAVQTGYNLIKDSDKNSTNPFIDDL